MHLKITPINNANNWDKLSQAEFLTKIKREVESAARALEGTVRWRNISYYSADFYHFFPTKILAKKFVDGLSNIQDAPNTFKVEIIDTGRQPSYMYPCTPGKGTNIDEDILAMISNVEET